MIKHWIKRFRIRTKESLGSSEAQRRIKKLESAIELEVLGKRRAEVDKAAAEAIASLIAAVKDTEQAVLRIGSLVVVKNNGQVWAEQVDELTARELEVNETILRRPKEVMLFFEEHRGHPPLDAPAPADEYENGGR